MTLKGIEMVGDAAIDGGGYGDIWKGLLNGQEIAVKVLRIFHKPDKNKLLKVGSVTKFVLEDQDNSHDSRSSVPRLCYGVN